MERYLWRKSQRSVLSQECVEITIMDGAVMVRDSKDPDGPWLAFDRWGWEEFIRGVKWGEFDL